MQEKDDTTQRLMRATYQTAYQDGYADGAGDAMLALGVTAVCTVALAFLILDRG